MELDTLRDYYHAHYQPDNIIFSVAGNVDANKSVI
jgi:predicted Zn-dependent peptidase